MGRVTSGGYGYTVEKSIAYAYLPAEHEVGTEIAVEIFGEWVPGVIADEPLFDPRGRADPRVTFAAEVERVWPGRGARFEVLGGGITNHNLKVEVDGERFVLRVAGKDTEPPRHRPHGRARRDRRPPPRSASGPRSSSSSSPRAGSSRASSRVRSLRWSACASRRCSSASRRALRAFHDGAAIPGSFDSFRVVESYRQTALDRGGSVPDAYDWAHEVATRIEATRSTDAPVPCHNDLLNANFLDDGEQPPHRRLGVRGHGRPVLRPRELLRSTTSSTRRRASCCSPPTSARFATPDAQALELMRFMSDFREAMWGVVQSAVSELDFDFDAYAAEHFARLERTAAVAGVRRGARGLNDEGRLAAPFASRRGRGATSASVGSANSPSLLLLEPFELLLGAHPHRALEPVLRRQRPPAAEDEADAGEPEDRVVRELPVERVVPRQADRVQREDEQDRDQARPRGSRRRRATCSAVRGSTRAARPSCRPSASGGRRG